MARLNLDVIWPRLIAAADEMATTLFRTAFSHDVVEVHDMSTGLYDDRGNLLGQTWLGATGHVGVMPVVGKELVRKFPARKRAARRHLHLQRPLGLQRADGGYLHLHARLPSRSGHWLLGEQRASRRYWRPQGFGPQRGGVRGRSDYSPDAPCTEQASQTRTCWPSSRATSASARRSWAISVPRWPPAGWGPRLSCALPAITGSTICARSPTRSSRARSSRCAPASAGFPRERSSSPCRSRLAAPMSPQDPTRAHHRRAIASPPTSQAPARRSAGPSIRR